MQSGAVNSMPAYVILSLSKDLGRSQDYRVVEAAQSAEIRLETLPSPRACPEPAEGSERGQG